MFNCHQAYHVSPDGGTYMYVPQLQPAEEVEVRSPYSPSEMFDPAIERDIQSIMITGLK